MPIGADMSESWRAKHLQVRSEPFEWTANPACFTKYQQRALSIWGSWLRALGSGRLAPETEYQRHFVQAMQDKVPTTTWWEALWRRYLTLGGSHTFTSRSDYAGVGGPSGISRSPIQLIPKRTSPLDPQSADHDFSDGKCIESDSLEPDDFFATESDDDGDWDLHVEEMDYLSENGVYPDGEVEEWDDADSVQDDETTDLDDV